MRESLNQPLMLVIEDLHQIDDETQALLNLVADSIGTSRVLLLVNYRPEYSHSWGSKTYYTQVRIDPLGKESADEMLSVLLGNHESLASLKRLITEKAEGNPLFMEEIYQALIEEGVLACNGAVRITRPLNALKIPDTVQAILAARIDRLPPEQKNLLETVAVIGRDFRLGLIRKVVARPHEELERTLAELQLAEFIYEQPAAGDIEYTFKHQLTREAAYKSALIERRKVLHERVAQAIEELGANSLDDHLAELAHHYERGGNRTKAVDYLTRAGTQLAQRSAWPEAMQHLERALAILKEIPAARTRDSRELQLQLAIGYSAFAHKGEGSADAGKAMVRVVELAVGPEDTQQRVQALISLGSHYVARAELQPASEIARVLYECARETRNLGAEFYANMLMGHVATFMGQFRKAEQFMRAAAASDSISAWQPGYALERRGYALWCLGFPHQALALAREGLRFGEGADDRYTYDRYWYAAMLFWAGATHMFCGELAEAEDLLRKSLNICTERGFLAVLALNTISMGLGSVLRGEAPGGLEQIQRGIELFPASWLPFEQRRQRLGYYLALGLASVGRTDEAFPPSYQPSSGPSKVALNSSLPP